MKSPCHTERAAENRATCETCRAEVIPRNNACPWCDTPIQPTHMTRIREIWTIYHHTSHHERIEATR
jgi:hypothetical protein